MGGSPLRVLVSHTRELREHPPGGGFVAAVESAIARAGMAVSNMAYFGARDQTPASVCVEQVAKADVLVGVLGMRYGSSVRDRPEVSYTELEFDTATALGIPRLMFLLDEEDPSVPLPASALVDRRYGDRQDAFRSKVSEAGVVTEVFATPAQLAMQVYQALVERSRRTAPGGTRSRYLAQVEDIAPLGGALGRESELTELHAWCFGDEEYVWWQAPPWAGKSALMATFVLRPPPGVKVVSFFVTGRLAAQSDSTAFTDAVIEQLAALVGEGVPASLTPAQRDLYRRDLLREASASAVQQGERLVLLVDGLDEDTGGGPGSGLASIASLLPKRLPAGLRVVVAGRPNPDLRPDVALDHPLRTCRRRPLSTSPYATEVARSARLELDELLSNDVRQRDVIGLITAAGGGLTSADLQRLTHLGGFEIESMLAGVCGRTVVGRTETSQLTDRRVFLFAHESLREEAVDRLGVLLDGYRTRIHDWIDDYRRQGWPSGTPVYALNGYYQLLSDLSDTGRMVLMATDPRRHDRMLDTTGGDTAAFAEVRTAQNVLLAATEPDLAGLARLNVHHTALAERNAHLPAGLPAVWARLGQVTRAEALANGVTDTPINNPHAKAAALTWLAMAVAQGRDYDRAESIARSISDRDQRVSAFIVLVAVVWEIGDHDRARTLIADAEAIARTITDPHQQATACTSLAATAWEIGDHDRAQTLTANAEAIARTITDPYQQASACTTVAATAWEIGDHDRARTLTANAEAIARTMRDPHQQALVCTDLAAAVGHMGDDESARLIARIAVGPYNQALALVALTEAAAGDSGRAEALTAEAEAMARSIADSHQQASALAAVAKAVGLAGDHGRARTMAADAESIARSITQPHVQAPALAAVVEVLVQSGDLDRAEAVARSITDDAFGGRSSALADVARAMVVTGDHDRAEAIADDIASPHSQGYAMAALADAASSAGDHERAESIARSIIEPRYRASALTALAEVLTRTGDWEHAKSLAVDTESIARSITDAHQQASSLSALATAFAQTGDHDRAEAIAYSISTPDSRASALTSLAKAVTETGDHDRAHVLATDAEAAARAIPDWHSAASQLIWLVEALGQAGDYQHAEAIARRLDGTYRARALRALTEAMVLRGEHNRAEMLTHDIDHATERGQALAVLAEAVSRAGDRDRAEAMARTIIGSANQVSAFVSLAKAAAQAGDHDRAKVLVADAEAMIRGTTSSYALIRGVGSLYSRTSELTRLADAVALVGERRRAEALIAEAEAGARDDADPYDAALDLLVEAWARTGDPDRAETIARSANPGTRGSVLSTLVRIVAEMGDHDRAETIAHSIADPYLQAWALGDIASVVARDGPSSAGRRRRMDRLMAHALAAGPWLASIRNARDVSPAIAVAIDQQMAAESAVNAGPRPVVPPPP